MKNISSTWVVVVVVVSCVIGGIEAQQECVAKLTACVDFINGTKPDSVCCGSIKDAVKNELTCLCSVYNTPGLLQQFGVSVDQALNLTTNCGVPVTLDRCSATSPTTSTTPTTTTGRDNNASPHTTTPLYSLLFLFLFFLSTLFF